MYVHEGPDVWRFGGQSVRVLRPELDQPVGEGAVSVRPPSAIRILVTGSRDWPRDRAVEVRDAIEAVARGFARVTIVHGACQDKRGKLIGADAWADLTAVRFGYDVERYPADWDRYGKGAGPRRNAAMVALGADVCVAFPMGESRGTRGCMALAEEAGIPVLVHPDVATGDVEQQFVLVG